MFEKYRQKSYFSATFTILLMLITTLLSFGAFRITQSNASNIGLLYILALILVSRYTDGYRYGFVFTIFHGIATFLNTVQLIHQFRHGCDGMFGKAL